MSVHPSAIVDPRAELAAEVEVGPFSIIDDEVVIGPRCRIAGHAWLSGATRLDEDVVVGHGAVIGAAAQDLSFDPDTPSGVRIGPRSTIREYATIHRATRADAATIVGADCFIMAHAHLAHDVVLGDKVVVCNNSLVPGHVVVGDRVFISGNVVIHQFCRIGCGAMIGGAAAVGQDVPPWTTIIGRSQIRALNVVGMRRAGLDAATRLEIRTLYRAIFAEHGDVEHARALLAEASDRPAVAAIRAFYAGPTRRGFCWPPRTGFEAADGEA